MLRSKPAGTWIAILLGAAGSAAAQAAHPPAQGSVAFEYSYMRANQGPGNCGCFNLSGGSGELAIPAWRGLSVVARITGEHAADSSIEGQGLSLAMFTAGPRWSYPLRGHAKLVPFAQGLGGVIHGFDAPFPTPAGAAAGAASAAAVQVGGGLDVALRRHLSLRAFEANYTRTYLPNNVNAQQNLLNLEAGVVLKFP